MIHLSIREGTLTVEDKTGGIFDWKNRAFFNISLGLETDEENNRYIVSETSDFLEIVKEITSYLVDEKLNFEADEAVAKLISNIEEQEAEFSEVKDALNVDVGYVKSTTFQRDLKSYQESAVEHLLRIRHGANFSVPGSGKTTMVYAYFDQLRQQGIVEKLFVVGPFSSFSPWEEESEKCFDRRLISARLVGNKRQSYYLLSQNYELFLCHYQTAANDQNEIIDLCHRYRILFVVDESHYIKRFSGGVWSDALLTIAPHATRRVILSGTPMPNGFVDLWSQITFLWPGKQVLGERATYKNRCESAEEQEEIKREIRPFFYRVKKSDLGLPNPNTIITEYKLKPIQAQVYHALSVRLITDLKIQPSDRQKLKLWRKAKMVRLLQAATNPTLLNRYSNEFDLPPLSADGTSLIELIEKYPKFEIPTKFEAAISLVRRLISEGKKVLLWTSFIHNIEMLTNQLADLKLFTVHGAVPKDEDENEVFNREKEIREFKASQEPCLLIANPAACAESISLHKVCHDAIYLDRTFNCGQFIQSMDRIHRIGLDPDEKVNYHILIAKGTIDETIDSRLREKHTRMIHVLEDEIPVGDLDVDAYEIEESDEIAADFSATVSGIQTFLNSNKD